MVHMMKIISFKKTKMWQKYIDTFISYPFFFMLDVTTSLPPTAALVLREC